MEKVFKASEHATWLREQAAAKRPYWYGVPYQRCTEALLARKAKQYPGHYGASRMARYRQDIAAGQFAGDCVNGAIKGAVWSELGRREQVYASHGCPDRSADGMFSYCKGLGMDWGAIGSMPDEIGLAVRFAGHVGVYVGYGEVVEWRGFNYGCVITRLSARPWTHWYRLPWTDYDGGAAAQPDEGSVDLLGGGNLKKGSKGETVRVMQELLAGLGYDLGKYGADGEFGSATQAAVKQFQQDCGLNADGVYGPKTHAALMERLAEEDEEDGDMPAETGKLVEVTGGTVYIRESAGTGSAIMTVVRKGQKLKWQATAESGWHAVKLPDGRAGWIGPKYSRVVAG